MTSSRPSEAGKGSEVAQVSVALCTFNGAEFLSEQLDSILNQSQPPAEIIISDDGSTDQTLAIVASYLERDPVENRGVRLRLLEPVGRQGVAVNFERAIAACSESVIALCDQDDLWAPDKLTRLTSFLDDRPECLLVHSDALLVNHNGISLGYTLLDALRVSAADRLRIHSGGALALLLRRNVVTGATTIFRRELFSLAQPFPRGWIHDEWLALTAAVGGGVDLLDAPLIDYRQHDRNEIGARKLSLRIFRERFFGSRATRNQQILVRSEALLERIHGWATPLPKEIVVACTEKLEHERVRSGLSTARVLRLWPILRELSTGRYTRYGNGVGDAIRDVLQSA